MKKIYKIILTIIVILLFIGTILLIALGNPLANNILKKVP